MTAAPSRLTGRRAALLAALWLIGCTAPATVPTTAPASNAAVAPPAVAAAPRLGFAAPLVPEGTSGWTSKPGWSFSQWAVAAANPLATEAGYRMLAEGGSAIDAAVAVQMVLTLVEPQSSGIGGGAFILHWDGRQVQAIDGRETAPAAATEALFLRVDGRPMPFGEAVVGGRAVGVPGAVRALHEAHRAHGRLPWARLLEPAITLAHRGFAVSPRLHAALASEQAMRRQQPAGGYWYDAAGQPWPVGHVMTNPALAAVLQRLAAEGPDALHRGAVAADIVARVRGHVVNPGLITEADLAGYQVRRREAICTDWQALYRVCGFPPPSSGHLTVMQILGLLEARDATKSPLQQGVPSADWLHVYLEAARLAYADRGQYIADPDFVPAPGGDWRTMVDPAYLRQRAALIGERSVQVAQPGQPAAVRSAFAPQPDQPEHGTSHISIVDGQGRAVAITTTIEAVWGSRLMSDGGTGLAGGFMLNNQLTDFSMLPADAAGKPIANRVQPGKRPRSSMSPSLVFDRRDGRLVMTAGSPGGPAIIHFTAKTLLGSLAWGLDAQRAIDLPNFGSYNGPTLLEKGRFAPEVAQTLRARNHVVNEIDLTSGLQAIQRTPTGWHGGADPRREGVVMGR
ncbi:MAG: gamma-glutamyltransferase family protein [Aquabacterium sp.]